MLRDQSLGVTASVYAGKRRLWILPANIAEPQQRHNSLDVSAAV
jgi:hypothetical protein